MTTTRHTALPFGGPLTSAAMNSPLSQLDTAIVAAEAALTAEAGARAAAVSSGDTALGARLDAIIIDSGTSDAETIDARGGYTTLREKVRGGVFDVRDYGADPTGVVDSTAMVRAAIDDVPATGGIVSLPGTEFKISTTITLPSYVFLRGLGSLATTLRWAGSAATHMFDATGEVAGGISDLTIAGPVGSPNGYGIKFSASFDWLLSGVCFAYLERAVALLDNSGDQKFLSCIVRSCTVGVLANSKMNYWTGGSFLGCPTGIFNSAEGSTGGGLSLTQVTFAGGGVGVRHVDLPSSGEYYFTQCWFEESTTTDARIGNGTTGPQRTVFQGCHFHTNGTYNLDLQSGASGTVVIGCVFDPPNAVLIGATHYRSVFSANIGATGGGDVAITDNCGDAYIQSLGAVPVLDYAGGELRGGTGASAMVLSGKTTAIGAPGMNFLVKNDAGVATTFMYAVAGYSVPVVAFPAGNLGVPNLQVNGNVGFYAHAPAAKPTVAGSRGSNAALASLLTALAGLGLLTDSSS